MSDDVDEAGGAYSHLGAPAGAELFDVADDDVADAPLLGWAAAAPARGRGGEAEAAPSTGDASTCLQAAVARVFGSHTAAESAAQAALVASLQQHIACLTKAADVAAAAHAALSAIVQSLTATNTAMAAAMPAARR